MSEWKRWDDEPPTLAREPIRIKVGAFSVVDTVFTFPVMNRLMLANLEWAPTGLYREEIFRVTGEWI
jgi:hypothetical protein